MTKKCGRVTVAGKGGEGKGILRRYDAAVKDMVEQFLPVHQLVKSPPVPVVTLLPVLNFLR